MASADRTIRKLLFSDPDDQSEGDRVFRWVAPEACLIDEISAPSEAELRSIVVNDQMLYWARNGWYRMPALRPGDVLQIISQSRTVAFCYRTLEAEP
jgi:hypothetical protein